jgi:hypothetical protein
VCSVILVPDRDGIAVRVDGDLRTLRVAQVLGLDELGWATAEPIRTDVAGPSASNLDLAVDPRGNALIVWTQGGQVGSDSVWSNRYTPTGGWGIAESLRTDNTQRAFVPQVAIDPSGKALVVWHQDSSSFFENIWSSRFE